MIKLIIEVKGGCVVGVYSNAHQGQEFAVSFLDRDNGETEIESAEENERLDAVLTGPGWRGID